MPNDVDDWTGQQQVQIIGQSKQVLGDLTAPILAADQAVQTVTTGDPNPFGRLGLASLKAAAGLVIARVGALGAFTQGSNTNANPAFGQATSAGNCLVAWVAGRGNEPATVAGGWVKVISRDGGVGRWTQIWIKPNCGAAEAAPAFTKSGFASPLFAQLGEFSGVALAAPTDQVNDGNTSGTPTLTTTNPAADVAFGDLELASAHWDFASSLTATWATTFNNGAAAVRAGGSGATPQSNHAVFDYAIIPGAAVSVPLGIQNWPYDLVGTSAPAVNVKASVIFAAVAGKRYTAAYVVASSTQGGATAIDNLVQILDGATVVWQQGVALPATTVGAALVNWPNLALLGTAGNSMTAQFDLASTTARERVSFGAYLR